MHRIEAYIRLAFIFIVIISILSLPILIPLKRKGKNVFRLIGSLLFFCSVFLIVFATIFYMPINLKPEQYILNLVPFQRLLNDTNFQQLFVEIIPNIMMFIPFGFLIPIMFKTKRRIYKVIFIVFLTSFAIEFFQYFIGRSSDIDDIISNVLGGILGYLIYSLCHFLFKNRDWWKQLNNKEMNE